MFVESLLSSHFVQRGVYLLPRRLGKPQHKRGICEYALAQREILTTLKQEAQAFCTTMFDYYRMPSSWPRREEARGQKPPREKARMVEDAVLADISGQLGVKFNRSRFIPYVQMHEFEALLFSDPVLLAQELDLPEDTEVQRTRETHSPEEINDGEQTAPSKRIIALNPGYSKVLDGVRISQSIGLDAMRAQCPHFNEWIQKLEALASR